MSVFCTAFTSTSATWLFSAAAKIRSFIANSCPMQTSSMIDSTSSIVTCSESHPKLLPSSVVLSSVGSTTPPLKPMATSAINVCFWIVSEITSRNFWSIYSHWILKLYAKLRFWVHFLQMYFGSKSSCSIYGEQKTIQNCIHSEI